MTTDNEVFDLLGKLGAIDDEDNTRAVRYALNAARAAGYESRDKCCVCTEYPWPHGIGVGRCHGAYPVRGVFGAQRSG